MIPHPAGLQRYAIVVTQAIVRKGYRHCDRTVLVRRWCRESRFGLASEVVLCSQVLRTPFLNLNPIARQSHFISFDGRYQRSDTPRSPPPPFRRA